MRSLWEHFQVQSDCEENLNSDSQPILFFRRLKLKEFIGVQIGIQEESLNHLQKKVLSCPLETPISLSTNNINYKLFAIYKASFPSVFQTVTQFGFISFKKVFKAEFTKSLFSPSFKLVGIDCGVCVFRFSSIAYSGISLDVDVSGAATLALYVTGL